MSEVQMVPGDAVIAQASVKIPIIKDNFVRMVTFNILSLP